MAQGPLKRWNGDSWENIGVNWGDVMGNINDQGDLYNAFNAKQALIAQATSAPSNPSVGDIWIDTDESKTGLTVAWGDLVGSIADQSDLNDILAAKYAKPSTGIPVSDLASDVKSKLVTVSNASAALASSSWSSNEQTVSVVGVTATNGVIVSPIPSDMTAYGEAGIKCISQNTDALVFSCENVPSTDLNVSVMVIG